MPADAMIEQVFVSLDELTCRAIASADVDDIVGVERCLQRRREIIEKTRLFRLERQCGDVVRQRLEKIAMLDKQLLQRLEIHRGALDTQAEKISLMKKLRSKFLKRCCVVPRFIDCKM